MLFLLTYCGLIVGMRNTVLPKMAVETENYRKNIAQVTDNVGEIIFKT